MMGFFFFFTAAQFLGFEAIVFQFSVFSLELKDIALTVNTRNIYSTYSNFSTRVVFSFVKLFSCTEHIVIANIEMNVQ